MGDWINSVGRRLIYTNVLIAMAAVAQCLLTYLVLSKPTHWPIVILEGSATLLLYNASLWLSRPNNPQASPYARTRWVFSHPQFFWLSSSVSVGMLLYGLWHIHLYTFLLLGAIGLMSMAYSLPLFRIGGRVGGLRQVPGLKLFHIAIVWSLSSVGLPVIELWASGVAVDWFVAGYLAVLKILFLMICCLPFDIRDMQQDSYYHLKTIPHLIGERRSKNLCYLFSLVHVLLVMVAPYTLAVKAGIITTNILIVLLLRYYLFRKENQFHDVYLLDAALIVQYLLVLFFSQIF